jgi:hypothetical protein
MGRLLRARSSLDLPRERRRRVSGKLVVNGIDARTGLYPPTPETEEELARRIRDKPLDPVQLRRMQWWIERYGIDDPNRETVQDVKDPTDLASAGWGVIFAPGIKPAVEDALKPLLDRRRDAAGPYFQAFRFQPGQTKEDFLAFNKTDFGPADPKRVPYYLLIVGSPEEIPFRFQYELDVQYAVGRIYFEKTEDYAAYAANVVEAESAVPQGEALSRKKVILFGVRTQGDLATQRSTDELIIPLAEVLRKDRPQWPVELVVGEEATKARLSRILGGDEAPSLLLTSSHGMIFPSGDPLQRTCQGALLCQDWPGPGHQPLPEHYFAGDDLSAGANLRGLIAFLFACYSGGAPETSNFVLDDSPLSVPQPVAPKPFLSHLAQRLLSHPRGALAVVGHVDRAWTTSFSGAERGQVKIFENTFKRLLDGHPLGSAMEYFNQLHAERSVLYTELSQLREALIYVEDEQFTHAFRSNNDARNFLVIGDPAVRIASSAGR